jgi:hypothetical protein
VFLILVLVVLVLTLKGGLLGGLCGVGVGVCVCVGHRVCEGQEHVGGGARARGRGRGKRRGSGGSILPADAHIVHESPLLRFAEHVPGARVPE